jgi:elongator complex protein 1
MRKLERGAKLIIAIHSETGCVLQMPRGNLETIHPRTLIISKLKHCIDSISYYTVVNLMRKHRINMNILFDHNPEKFLKNLVEFVKQIDDPTLLNLFLNELNDEDTTQTFYRDHYPQKTTINKDSNSNVLSIKFPKKVDRLCSNLIRICEELNAKKYFLVILTCHAKMKELEKALFKICQLKSKYSFWHNNLNNFN